MIPEPRNSRVPVPSAYIVVFSMWNELRREVLIGGIVDHHCLEVVVRFIDTDGIVDRHCLEVVVRFVDTDGIVDHH